MIKDSILIDILKDQVKPALGCTEPAAVALGVARAKEIITEEVLDLHITVNNNILKNGMSVGIPGTNERGLDFAAALALMVGKSQYGLEVFKDVDQESITKALEIVEAKLIEVELDKTKSNLFIKVVARGESEVATVIIEKAHTNIVFESLDDRILLDSRNSCNMDSNNGNRSDDLKFKIMDYSISELVSFVDSVPCEYLDFIQTGINMNLKLAQVGLMEDLGLGMGKHYMEKSNDVYKIAKAYTVAASEARMTGYPLPVMSSAGSGNHGLVAIIPLSIMGSELGFTEDRVRRAVALSHLVTIFVKVQLGALSPVCGCAVAAGLGCSAGISYLKDGTVEQIEDSIVNMIAGVSGMFCDGAKIGCAYKLGISVDAAVDAASMAMEGMRIPSDNGILGRTAEESISNLARVSTEGMTNTDPVILDIMMNKC
ncbi:MAG TPA: L-serine ammonia-lyase, iron-sulfur-dependent, subunit alpha [Tissierellaceae bacterium]|nr:L-serine ammonia-lyase, iron-sulfur-dependent, subunit alpha [Tissierellaceae bacterium]